MHLTDRVREIGQTRSLQRLTHPIDVQPEHAVAELRALRLFSVFARGLVRTVNVPDVGFGRRVTT